MSQERFALYRLNERECILLPAVASVGNIFSKKDNSGYCFVVGAGGKEYFYVNDNRNAITQKYEDLIKKLEEWHSKD